MLCWCLNVSTSMISLCWLSQPPCLWNPQTGLVQDVCATGLCLALEQSHKHILNVLHQSPPVPQSHVTSLIPASSISSVSSSAWGLVMPRAFARVRSRNHHQIFRQISIVDLPRILLVLSRLVSNSSEVSGTEPAISPAVFL